MHRMKATLLFEKDVAFIFGEAGGKVGLSLQAGTEPGNAGKVFRHGMAWILCIGFFAQQWVYTSKGTWLIVPGDISAFTTLFYQLVLFCFWRGEYLPGFIGNGMPAIK
ncbi:hypothetical protein [Thermoactinomyces mirandus]|uniref:Uncharacterized protein n=1 Tax=Thermoactinomyces mirandus TaxID=2756294 RepID=A0A7W1XRS2_9BACL|nr:hypothetical protein [Thermoactinomyces mirandus]MBA4602011.1 hypothetical protein [Thermoactinomyces mirandus]